MFDVQFRMATKILITCIFSVGFIFHFVNQPSSVLQKSRPGNPDCIEEYP